MTKNLISPASLKKLRRRQDLLRKLFLKLDPNPWDDEHHNRKWVWVKVGNKLTKVEKKS